MKLPLDPSLPLPPGPDGERAWRSVNAVPMRILSSPLLSSGLAPSEPYRRRRWDGRRKRPHKAPTPSFGPSMPSKVSLSQGGKMEDPTVGCVNSIPRSDEVHATSRHRFDHPVGRLRARLSQIAPPPPTNRPIRPFDRGEREGKERDG